MVNPDLTKAMTIGEVAQSEGRGFKYITKHGFQFHFLDKIVLPWITNSFPFVSEKVVTRYDKYLSTF